MMSRDYHVEHEIEATLKSRVSKKGGWWHIEEVYMVSPQMPDLDITHCLSIEDRKNLASSFAIDRKMGAWREGEFWCDTYSFEATMVADWSRDEGPIDEEAYLKSRHSPNILRYLAVADYDHLITRIIDMGTVDFGFDDPRFAEPRPDYPQTL